MRLCGSDARAGDEACGGRAQGLRRRGGHPPHRPPPGPHTLTRQSNTALRRQRLPADRHGAPRPLPPVAALGGRGGGARGASLRHSSSRHVCPHRAAGRGLGGCVGAAALLDRRGWVGVRGAAGGSCSSTGGPCRSPRCWPCPSSAPPSPSTASPQPPPPRPAEPPCARRTPCRPRFPPACDRRLPRPRKADSCWVGQRQPCSCCHGRRRAAARLASAPARLRPSGRRAV